MVEINIPELNEINDKLDAVLSKLDQRITNPEHIIFDNQGLMDYLKIGKTKAAQIRNEGKITFYKESQTGKVWFKLSDVLDYLESIKVKKFC